jgi:cytoskeletal protein RodZ
MAEKEEAKTNAEAEAKADAKADAGKGQPQKRKLSLALPKLPLDMIVLVAIPFIAFVVIFLYAMGYIPAKPVVLTLSVVNPVSYDSQAQSEGPENLSPPATADTASVATESSEVPTEEGLAASRATSASGTAADTAFSIEQLANELGLADSMMTLARPDTLSEPEKAKKVKQMAKVYEQMNASSVAAIVDKLPEDEAVRILSVMTPRSAAKVLAALGPEKAADMSLILTGFGR